MSHAADNTAPINLNEPGLIDKFKNWVTNEEPVIARRLVVGALALLGQFLIGHKIIGTQQWSEDTNVILPMATAGLLTVEAWFTRSKVFSPASVAAIQNDASKVQSLLDDAQLKLTHSGLLTDADFGRLEVVLTDHVTSLAGKLLPKSAAG